METFIETIKKIKGDIEKQKEHQSLLIDNTVIQKQYLVYYVYRIICQHFTFFKSLALTSSIKDINEKLEISSQFKYVCYPLANRMTTNETKLDEIFQTMIDMFNTTTSKMKELKRDDENLQTYLNKKNYDTIITDIKELIRFVPNLSKFQYY